MGMPTVRYAPDRSMTPNARLTLFFEGVHGALEHFRSTRATFLANEAQRLCRGAMTKCVLAVGTIFAITAAASRRLYGSARGLDFDPPPERPRGTARPRCRPCLHHHHRGVDCVAAVPASQAPRASCTPAPPGPSPLSAPFAGVRLPARPTPQPTRLRLHQPAPGSCCLPSPPQAGRLAPPPAGSEHPFGRLRSWPSGSPPADPCCARPPAASAPAGFSRLARATPSPPAPTGRRWPRLASRASSRPPAGPRPAVGFPVRAESPTPRHRLLAGSPPSRRPPPRARQLRPAGPPSPSARPSPGPGPRRLRRAGLCRIRLRRLAPRPAAPRMARAGPALRVAASSRPRLRAGFPAPRPAPRAPSPASRAPGRVALLRPPAVFGRLRVPAGSPPAHPHAGLSTPCAGSGGSPVPQPGRRLPRPARPTAGSPLDPARRLCLRRLLPYPRPPAPRNPAARRFRATRYRPASPAASHAGRLVPARPAPLATRPAPPLAGPARRPGRLPATPAAPADYGSAPAPAAPGPAGSGLLPRSPVVRPGRLPAPAFWLPGVPQGKVDPESFYLL
nr:basic proline-rich protein-like [Aegilops tauschii subsp. strangulata]